MAGTIVADQLEAASTSTLVIKNGVANTPPTVQDSAGTQIGTFCRAWVNFNGTTNTGGFCTIRGSFNVTSVADNGTGDQTVNFTNALPDANYSAVVTGAAETNSSIVAVRTSVYSTTALRVNTLSTAFVNSDNAVVNVAVFR
jgi:hypothetical protein